MKDSVINSEQRSSPLLPELCAWALAFLFAYTAISKIYDWNGTQLSMTNQLIPKSMGTALLYLLPASELLATLLLLIPKFRLQGFLFSFLLMLVFSGYVAWVWLGLSHRVPCSCGGVVSALGWGPHLILNLLFLGIAALGWKMEVNSKRKQLNPKPKLSSNLK